MQHNEQEKQSRNLKGWTVKLPEHIIEEIEKLYEASGARFKNEFMEHLINNHKVNLLKEGKLTDELMHPEILKNSSSDIHELAKLTKMINELFIHQLEKFSIDRYETERMKQRMNELQSENDSLKQVSLSTSDSYLQDQIEHLLSNGMGHSLYLGTSGCGKNTVVEQEIKKAIATGKKVIALDPQGRYKELTKKVGGTTLSFSYREQEPLYINPLEFHCVEEKNNELNPLTQKILNVLSIIEVLIKRSLVARERKILLDTIEKTYEKFNITRATTFSTLNKEHMPTLSDLETTLRQYGGDAISIADELEPYTSGFLNQFNGLRNFSIYETPMLVFNSEGFEKEISQTGMFIMLEFIYNLIKQGIFGKTLLIVDQAWMLTQHRPLQDFIRDMLKQLANYSTRSIFITQSINDILLENHELFDCFKTKVYFKTHHYDLDVFKNILDFSDLEMNKLKHLEKGKAYVHVNNQLKFFTQFDQVETYPEISPKALY